MGILMLVLFVLVILAVASLFYRPLGTGAYSYAPSGVLWLVLIVLLILFLLHVV